jgi:Fe-S oxidoreductase
MGGNYEVLHYSELLNQLVAAKKLDLQSATGNRQSEIQNPKSVVTFHDSCYLGRYNKIYNQPRELLDKAGVNRVEMKRKGENSFCCGGGGGGMWLETDAETRINHRRLKDALDVKADVVATACPYCMLMFDDAIRSKGLGEQVKVMDIAEVLAAKMER